jgi:AraC-like DNA-binding protein
MMATSLPLHDWSSVHVELRWAYDAPIGEVFHRRMTHDHRVGHWAWFLRAGQARLVSPSGEYVARAGDWMFTPAERVTHEFTPGARLLSVNFLCQWPTGDNLFAGRAGSVFRGDEHPQLERRGAKLARLVRRQFPDAHIYYHRQPATYPQFVRFQRLFTGWLEAWHDVQVTRGRQLAYGGTTDERLLRAVRRLNEAPLSAGCPHELLRTETGLSKVQLDANFVRAFGLTPWRYWERRRLDHARRCLTGDAMSIKQVGYHLGFKSDSNFIAWFRRLTGQSPGAFRKPR